ncbi:segregation and condensation protein A [Propylenella binzhouense]|uniref:Segregation and condensation protein A n=1 Tax=Propylenella binzhouense TaxID=2555902 RepID=A0A964WSV8_9HYPH|nr:ScpA family protein [Propylenella binzhouense]MYZ47374.1 segregation/condensation protein A [Propylenella binzhouense]
MSEFGQTDDRHSGEPDRPALIVDIDGYEGPLDLLLTLAREQKVDLTRISVLALVEQYLAFIAESRRLELELAADYLVMAAWLAFLKSRLLLPEDPEPDDGPSGEELAAALAFRLRRLEAMRDAAARLVSRYRLGREVFPRGEPERPTEIRQWRWQATQYELLQAYAAQRQRQLANFVRLPRRTVFTLQDARERLLRLIGTSRDWQALDSFLLEFAVRPDLRATARASTLAAGLELAKEGRVEIAQAVPFAPLFLRVRAERAEADGSGGGNA